MGRTSALVAFVTFAVVCASFRARAVAQNGPAIESPFAGPWTYERSLSEIPPEIGFNAKWFAASNPDGQSTAPAPGGRGRRGSASGGARGYAGSSPGFRESYDDAQRLQLLTAEVRIPPPRLTIVDTPSTFIITNDLGQSRTLHPNGAMESIDLQGVPLSVTTKREGDRVVVLYRVEQGRELRYTYSHSANPSQLVVDVQFLEHGAGEKARYVYVPGTRIETPARSATTAPVPSASRPATEAFDQRPGAELKGLKRLGLLVEDFSQQALACGLNHDTIESALSRRLTDAGLVVRKNSDDDSYVYINVMTSTLPNGTCVSRYDAFLYTHATAKLSYHDQPVLVQISLAHRGGIGTSVPAAHPAAVGRGLETYVDALITQIREANK